MIRSAALLVEWESRDFDVWLSKKKIFDAIADEKDNPTKKQKVEDTLSKNHVNQKQYFNFLFSNKISPKLAMRGESLTKEQMADGIKRDELLHREIILEYNNKDKYNKVAHNIANFQGAHPSTFVPITWVHSKQMLNTVVQECKKAFKNWKISGFHGAFGGEDNDTGWW